MTLSVMSRCKTSGNTPTKIMLACMVVGSIRYGIDNTKLNLVLLYVLSSKTKHVRKPTHFTSTTMHLEIG